MLELISQSEEGGSKKLLDVLAQGNFCVWLNLGLVNSRTCLHLPTLLPRTCWYRLWVTLKFLLRTWPLSFSDDSVSAVLNKLKHGKSEGGSLDV